MRATDPLVAMFAAALVTSFVVPFTGSAQALAVESTIGVSSKGLSDSFSGPSVRGGVFYRVARTIRLGVEVGTGDRGEETQVWDPFSCVIGGTGDPTTCTVERTVYEDIQYAVLHCASRPRLPGPAFMSTAGWGSAIYASVRSRPPSTPPMLSSIAVTSRLAARAWGLIWAQGCGSRSAERRPRCSWTAVITSS